MSRGGKGVSASCLRNLAAGPDIRNPSGRTGDNQANRT